MESQQEVLENQWEYLCSYLPEGLDLDRSARDSGALVRRRGVESGEALLRLALAYSVCGFSLRQTAAWAQVAEVAHLSDVALLKRLRNAASWLGQILGAMLAKRVAFQPPAGCGLRVRLIDATSLSARGSRGTDWRVHLGLDLESLSIDHLELTDARGGETLRRLPVQPGELIVGDQGYAHRPGLAAVRRAGADFLVRMNWQNLPLQDRQGRAFDPLAAAREIEEAKVAQWEVQFHEGGETFPCRLVAVRKSEAAAEEARRKVLKERSRKGRVQPETLEAASYTLVLTSVSEDLLDPLPVLELYRYRWQIELTFKQLKSLLHLDELPMKEPELTQTYVYSKLLAALLLDDFTNRFLAFSPWGFPLQRSAPEPMAKLQSVQ